MNPTFGPRGRRRLPCTAIVVLLLMLSSSAAAAPWWRDAVFYEVFVRSFHDSDGDGIGDLRGVIDKLDYLNDGDPSTDDDLGVTGLWLMPIFASPSYHGYDVTDYYAVNPEYGTLDDVRDLLHEAHARGIRVIIDLVLNHTSDAHPWFEASRDPGDVRRGWYVWSDSDPGRPGPWGQRVWHFGGSGFYYGLFWSGMPDLNYRNPDVTARMFDVVRFWLDEVGVDGFRLDAVRHLIEDGEQQANTRATHFWLKGLRAVAKGWRDDTLLLGEVWDSPSEILVYYEHEMDLCFEFELADAILSGVLTSRPRGIEATLRTVLSTYPPARFASFLSNHDQQRVMSRLRGNEAQAKLAASILLTLPGTPFIYYGEEIGMTGTKPDERIRTPMQWSDEANAGFTLGVPWEPLSSDRLGRSVVEQSDRVDSVLSTYRRLVRLRTEAPILRDGELSLVDTGHPSILSYIRHRGASLVWVLHNLSALDARASRLSPADNLPLRAAYEASDLLDGLAPFTFRRTDSGTLEGGPVLAAHRSVALELKPL